MSGGVIAAQVCCPAHIRCAGILPAAYDTPAHAHNSDEQDLADDGALILKFWMHLSKAAQKKRLKKLEKDPLLSWRVSKQDWKHWRMYDQFMAAAERTLMKTSTGDAPWKIVEGFDERYRSVTVAGIIKGAIQHRLQEGRISQVIAEEMVAPQDEMAQDGREGVAPLTVSCS